MPDTATIEITDIGYGGEGVGHLDDGMALFVPFAAPGDALSVTVTSRRSRFARGVIREIHTPGPDRVEPPCPYYGTCGGCCFQHLTHEAELAAKSKQLSDLLQRVGHCETLPEIARVVRSPQLYGYRNKVTLHPLRADDRVRYGFVESDGKTVLPVRECKLAAEAINRLIPKISRTPWGKQNAKRERPRAVTLRMDAGGEAQLFFGRAPRRIPWLTELLAEETPVRVPLGGFFQVNPAVSPALFGWVAEQAAANVLPVLVDAYCGVGCFALACAPYAERVYGIETDSDSVEAAHHNAGALRLPQCTFIAGVVEQNLHQVLDAAGDGSGVRVLLDPPRTGCHADVIARIRQFRPAELVYVSCNPATLARDVERLGEEYGIVSLALFDMFPRTAHFESVVVLRRR